MTRRKKKIKKNTEKDPIYREESINKLINYVMIDGKKNKASRIVYVAINSLFHINKKTCLGIFKKAIKNISPKLEVRSRRIGGVTYQIPIEINKKRSLALSLKWLTKYSRLRRNEKKMEKKLGYEIMDAYNKRGESYRKREEMHKIAESNKAFSHYKW